MAQRAATLTALTVSCGEPLAWGRRTYVMGIINVTPDSFSGDGLGSDIPAILDRALRFEEEGADFLDVGAESTRPGATPISIEEELQRLKRDLLQQLPGGGLPRSVPMPSLFGSVRGGDITEQMVEESKKSLFQNIEDV